MAISWQEPTCDSSLLTSLAESSSHTDRIAVLSFITVLKILNTCVLKGIFLIKLNLFGIRCGAISDMKLKLNLDLVWKQQTRALWYLEVINFELETENFLQQDVSWKLDCPLFNRSRLFLASSGDGGERSHELILIIVVMEETRNAYRILMGKLLKKQWLGRLRRMWVLRK